MEQRSHKDRRSDDRRQLTEALEGDERRQAKDRRSKDRRSAEQISDDTIPVTSAICPQCGTELQFNAPGDELICTQCSKSAN